MSVRQKVLLLSGSANGWIVKVAENSFYLIEMLYPSLLVMLTSFFIIRRYAANRLLKKEAQGKTREKWPEVVSRNLLFFITIYRDITWTQQINALVLSMQEPMFFLFS